MKNSNNHIDLILYFIELKQRIISDYEIDLIKYLLVNNKRIIFILNNLNNYTKN